MGEMADMYGEGFEDDGENDFGETFESETLRTPTGFDCFGEYHAEHQVYVASCTVDLTSIRTVERMLSWDQGRMLDRLENHGQRKVPCFKVGHTRNLHRRLLDLEKQYGMKLELLQVENCQCDIDVRNARRKIVAGKPVTLFSCRREALIQERWSKFQLWSEWFLAPAAFEPRGLLPVERRLYHAKG